MFIVGDYPECPTCLSLVLPTGRCVNCGREPQVQKKLRWAIEAGREDAAKLAAGINDDARSAQWRAERERHHRARVDVLRDWFENHCYDWVREAVRQGKQSFTIGDEDDHRPLHSLDEQGAAELIEAIKTIEGFRPLHTQRETNMQDSSAPCWVTLHTVKVGWIA